MFKIGNIYIINQGNYKNKRFIVDWISKNKNILINNTRQHQVNGRIVDSKIKCNFPMSFLSERKINNNPLSKLSNLIIIKQAKIGNKKAVQEFIRRFKKMPKINK